MSNNVLIPYTSAVYVPPTVFKEDKKLYLLAADTMDKNDLWLLSGRTEITEKGNISAIVLIPAAGSLQLWNYHPMRKGYAYVYSLRSKEDKDVQEAVDQSIAALYRLIDIL